VRKVNYNLQYRELWTYVAVANQLSLCFQSTRALKSNANLSHNASHPTHSMWWVAPAPEPNIEFASWTNQQIFLNSTR
jgi:hypothetical protein